MDLGLKNATWHYVILLSQLSLIELMPGPDLRLRKINSCLGAPTYRRPEKTRIWRLLELLMKWGNK